MSARSFPAAQPSFSGRSVSAAADPQPAIRIRRVSKTFGTTRAVRNLDLDVPRGSLCGFLGPNGAGKSTTIRMIMSIIYPDTGTIEVLGGSALQSKDRIGYLPEERGVYRKMRVGEFLRYIARLKGVRRREAASRVRNWLERVELPHVLHMRCHELSKGMQQKVQFLAAIIHEPELIILDEPFSGLDPVNAALINKLMRELNEQGRTIIFSTHQLHLAEQLCDRIFLINHGVKLLDATLDEVRERYDPRTIAVRLLENASIDFTSFPGVRRVSPLNGSLTWELHLDDEVDPQSVMREIVSLVPTRAIELRQLSLDDVFVRLVMQDEGSVAAERAREELRHG